AAVGVGVAGADFAELARVVDRSRLPGIHQPGHGEERHEPHGDPVAALKSHAPPRTRAAAPSGRAGWRAPPRPPAAPASGSAPVRAGAPGRCRRAAPGTDARLAPLAERVLDYAVLA